MGFNQAFHAAATFASPPTLDDFRKQLDPAWIEEALLAKGTATMRRRRLPADQVIWVLLGLGMFRDRPIEHVVSKLDLVLPGAGSSIARSSVSQARDRIGSEPIRMLFERSASVWSNRSAEAHEWRGLRSHLLAACNFGHYGANEIQYAKPLLAAIPSNELIEVKVSDHARRQDPSLPKTWQMRAVRYRRKGFSPQLLLTSLRDPKEYPATELAELYHERWELELGYDEIKTELLDREETIRSKKPEGVKQELWGIFLAYNLIRLEMARIAAEADVAPIRISFVEARRLIRDEWEWLTVTSPGAIPKRLETMRRNVKRYILPPRRSRSFPRAVKIKMSSYESR